MAVIEEQPVVDFYCYPPVGDEDWQYGYATARARVLESMMINRGILVDMANADTFDSAIDMLGGSEYSISSGAKSFAEIGEMLLAIRTDARELFAELIVNEDLVGLLAAREDFANMRLAVRRIVTERPIGVDYSNQGSVPAEEFEEIFEQENYSRFPYYLQEAVEAAVLGYYQNKDICQIDYEIDRIQAQYKLKRAEQLDSVFLRSLFRVQIDLTNIRTMLRLKLGERDERDLFLPGGFVAIDRLNHALDVGYEAITPLFYATPYHGVLEAGVGYLTSEQSFLRLEKECEDYLMGFLKTTGTITAGPQPVIAYLLMKENEIRTVRMILTGKKNDLEARLILDRLVE